MSMEHETPKKKRGFASMDPELRRAIASQGGKTAHARKLAHEFTPEEARRAAAIRRQKQATAVRALFEKSLENNEPVSSEWNKETGEIRNAS